MIMCNNNESTQISENNSVTRILYTWSNIQRQKEMSNTKNVNLFRE